MTQKLQDPPATLPPLQPGEVASLESDTLLARVHSIGGSHPTAASDLRWFGPLAGKGRFDHHPAGPPRIHAAHGIAYLAAAGDGDGVDDTLDLLLAEQVQDGDTLEVPSTLTLSILELTDTLHVLDASGSWSQRTRCGVHLSTAPHAQVQKWARAVHRDYPDLTGIRYRPSTGGHAWALAITERGHDALSSATLAFQRSLADPAMARPLAAAAERLRIKLAHIA